MSQGRRQKFTRTFRKSSCKRGVLLVFRDFRELRTPRPATGVSDGVSQRAPGSGVSNRVSRECLRSVPRVSTECLGHLFDTPGTLSGHFLDTPEPGAGENLSDTPSDTPGFRGHSRGHSGDTSGPKRPRDSCSRPGRSQ